MTALSDLDLTKPCVVGIVNATPDSFSDAGPRGPEAAIELGLRHLADGAAIVEVGGESNVSNRPAVAAEEEIARVGPVVERLAVEGAVISIDTHKPEVARAALRAGAAIVNDISGLCGHAPGAGAAPGDYATTGDDSAAGGDEGAATGDTEGAAKSAAMIGLCAEYSAAVVVMHTATQPKIPRWDEGLYPDGTGTHVRRFFEERLAELDAAGIPRERVILDPGPDFAKTPRQTVEALRAVPEYRRLGCPVMLAVSRKDFIGAVTGRTPRRREAGTFAALAAGLDAGATVLRVHDVAGTVDFLRVRQALNGEVEVAPELRIDDSIRWEPPAEFGPGGSAG